MKVFLSYASELGDEVARVATQLRAKGHDVFYDEASLPPGEGYHERIKAGVRECDLFVVFVSPEAAQEGRYTLTELGYAKERWPNPSGKVLPVMARPTELKSVDPYLTEALSIFTPIGNFAIEVSNEVENKLQRMPAWRRYLVKVITALLVAAAALVVGVMVIKTSMSGQPDPAGISADCDFYRDLYDFDWSWTVYSPSEFGVERFWVGCWITAEDDALVGGVQIGDVHRDEFFTGYEEQILKRELFLRRAHRDWIAIPFEEKEWEDATDYFAVARQVRLVDKSGDPLGVTTLRAIQGGLQQATGDSSEVTITFINRGDAPVGIYWVNHERQEEPFGTLQPQEVWPQPTYEGHIWVVRPLGDSAAPAVLTCKAAARNPVCVIEPDSFS